ncbi:MAG: GGDEF domain-containing protein [Actinomycetota bacterium]|nr:GGDEF domain-containing protein [Actinomycetota bacterium]
MVPLFMGRRKIGTLVIANDTQTTRALIRNVKLYGIAALVLIFSLLVTVMYTSYRKGRDLARHAYYNAVTGLPNSKYFEEFIAEKIKKKKDNKKAILMVSYRNFKLVNLTFGYKYGDKVLYEFASSLSRLCLDDCNLFHLAAGRFIIYIQNYRDKNELAEFR